MKNFLSVIWKWLDGNKMLFGALIMVLVEKGVFGSDGIDYLVFDWLGKLLAGGGLLHKIVKGTDNT